VSNPGRGAVSAAGDAPGAAAGEGLDTGHLGTSTNVVVLTDDLFDEIEFDAARTGDHRRAALRMNHLAATAEQAGSMSRAEAHMRAGEQWLLADEPTDAVEQFQKAIADGGPTFDNPRVSLARAMFALGRTEDADALLREVANKSLAAASELATVDDTLRLLLLAQQPGVLQQRVGEAIPVHFFAALGAEYAAAGDADRASEACRRAVALNPGDTDTQFEFGEALYAKGKYAEAATAFEQVARAVPLNAEAHENLGDSYRALGRFDAAAAAYRDAARLKPDDAALHEAVELDPAEDHVDDPPQGLGDDPPDDENYQENQDLGDGMEDRVEQVLEAIAYLK